MKWLLIIFCCLVSCTRTIEVSLPAHEPRLVLHGYVATGEKFHVSVNQSARASNVMSGDETLVTNAWVLLYENDVFADSLKYDALQKRYISANMVAVPGKTYKVIAGADGFTNVEASAVATFPVNAISVVHEKNTRSNSTGEQLDDVLFSFNDAGNEKNFYKTSLHSSLWARVHLFCVYSNDPAVDRIRGGVLPFEEGACIDSDQVLFSDKSFNGNLKQFSISAQTEYLKTNTDSSGNLHRPYIKRSVISEAHYKYLKATLSLYAGGVIPSYSQPVAIEGNVKNGYGLLSVFSVTTDTLR